MADTGNPRAVIGANGPPEPTPMAAARALLADLDVEASAWFDGEPIATEGQAADVSRLLDAARKAEKRLDADRKAEKQPHDAAAKAVDARWKPLLTDAARIVEVAKKALAPWLVAKDAEKRAAEADARRIADEAAAEARRLATQETATLADAKARDAAIDAAKVLEARAAAAERDKAGAKGAGMARTVSLRTTWKADVTDRRALLNHIARTRPDDLGAWLDEWAAAAVRTGARELPGVNVWQERVAA